MVSGRVKAKKAGRVHGFVGVLMSWYFILRAIWIHGNILSRTFSIVPFGSSVYDGLGEISSEAVGIM